MKKKRIFGIAILAVLICVLFIIIKNINQSPYDFLKNRKSNSKAENVTEFLYQEDIGDNKYVLFYVNENGNMSCAIIKKSLFNYNILKISSEVVIANELEPAELHFSAYNKGHNWIYWGVIRDDKIKKVLIHEKEANLIDVTYGFRICYIMGTGIVESELPKYELIY